MYTNFHFIHDNLTKIGKNEEYVISIEQQTKQEFKKHVKNNVRQYTLLELNKVKEKENNKIRNVLHTQLIKPQNYLLSNKLKNKHKSLLFNLRSNFVNGFKDSFHGMHQNYIWVNFPRTGILAISGDFFFLNKRSLYKNQER